MSQIITPSNPINGQEIVVNGTVLVYVEAEQVWRVQVESESGNALLLAGKLDKPSGDPLLVPSVVQVALDGSVSYVQLTGGTTPHSPRVTLTQVSTLSLDEIVIPKTTQTLFTVEDFVGPITEFTFLDITNVRVTGDSATEVPEGLNGINVTVPADPTEAVELSYDLRYTDLSDSSIHRVRRTYTARVGVAWYYFASTTVPTTEPAMNRGILHIGDSEAATTSASATEFWALVRTSDQANFRLKTGPLFATLDRTTTTGTAYAPFDIGGISFTPIQVERGSSLGTLRVEVTGV